MDEMMLCRLHHTDDLRKCCPAWQPGQTLADWLKRRVDDFCLINGESHRRWAVEQLREDGRVLSLSPEPDPPPLTWRQMDPFL